MSPSPPPPRASVLTPGGRGAIAVVAVVGDGAVEAVDTLFRAASGRPLADTPTGRIAFGRWGGERGEEVVVARFDDRVEVHCHGGIAASGAILDALTSAGCERCDPHLAITPQQADPIAAAAHTALTAALTERTALVLVDQLNGALGEQLGRIIMLTEQATTDEAAAAVDALLARWHTLGSRLTTPLRVVLTGPPNVGKSSLINALVGYERAIVFDRPGTTRDLVTATTAIDGWAVELVDTAGLRAGASGVEQAGIALAERAAATADLVLEVREAAELFNPTSSRPVFAADTSDDDSLYVLNKEDLLPAHQRQLLEQQPRHGWVLASATTPGGVEELLAAIRRAITPPDLPPAAAVPFTAEQAEALELAQSHLAAGDTRAARQVLLALLEPGRS